MTVRATGHVRGHDLGPYTWDGKDWTDKDGDPIRSDDTPCRECGLKPTPEGYDACLGFIPGAAHACCGHGVTEPYVMWSDGGHPEPIDTFRTTS